MSQDPFQALYSGIGGALLLHLTTIESIYPTVCVCVRVTLELNMGLQHWNWNDCKGWIQQFTYKTNAPELGQLAYNYTS